MAYKHVKFRPYCISLNSDFEINYLADNFLKLRRFYIAIWFGSFSWKSKSLATLGQRPPKLVGGSDSALGQDSALLLAALCYSSDTEDKFQLPFILVLLVFLWWTEIILVPKSVGQGEIWVCVWWGSQWILRKWEKLYFFRETNNFSVLYVCVSVCRMYIWIKNMHCAQSFVTVPCLASVDIWIRDSWFRCMIDPGSCQTCKWL